jgi:hypothetical protein
MNLSKTLAALVGVMAAMTGTPVASADAALAAARGPFRIAQIHYEQGATLNSEYIVVKNITNRRRDLSGFRIVDPQDGQRYRFRATTLRAGRSVVLHTGKGRDNPGDRFWDRSEPVWNNDGDTALLKNRAGVTVDRCSYDGNEPGGSAPC